MPCPRSEIEVCSFDDRLGGGFAFGVEIARDIGLIQSTGSSSGGDKDIRDRLMNIIAIELIHLISREPFLNDISAFVSIEQCCLCIGAILPLHLQIEEKPSVGEALLWVIAN